MNTYMIQKLAYIPVLGRTLSLLPYLMMGLSTFHSPVYAQSTIGKIVIDGVVYGEGDSNVLKGNGVKANEVRSITAFQNLQITGSVDVFFQQAPTTHLEISGDQNILPLIKTEVRAGTLKIYAEKSYQPSLPLVIQVSGPSLQVVSLDGAGDVQLDKINGNSLKLDVNGSGDVKAQGQVSTFSAGISGSGNIDAQKLSSNNAQVSITGSGDIKVTAKQHLKASITGSGDIQYYGNPTHVEPSILGSGDIEAGD